MNIKHLATLALVTSSVAMPTAGAQETEALSRFTEQMDSVIEYVEDSCEMDAKKFCSTVTPGEGRLLMCALAYRDQVSVACDVALFDAFVELGDRVNNLQFSVEACRSDIETTCKEVEPGEGRIAQCLIDNKANLSMSCKGAVADFESAN